MRKLVLLRKCSQIFFLALFVTVLWSTTYPLNGPMPPAVLFKIDPLIMFTTALSIRVILPGLMISLVLVLLTSLFGRFFCGWVCPLGTIIDGCGAVTRTKTRLSDRRNQKVRRFKYFVLGALFLTAAAGIQTTWSADPLVMTARFVSLNLIPAVTWAIEHGFIFLISNFDLYGPVTDFYRDLKGSLLGVHIHFFMSSVPILLLFVAVVAPALVLPRAWCRVLCPLGALLNACSRRSILERRSEGCVGCRQCREQCRMGAIRGDNTTHKGECILCMNCVYVCSAGNPESPTPKKAARARAKGRKDGLSRREFLFLLLPSFSLFGLKKFPVTGPAEAVSVIRPPGALREDQFLGTCVRCGNCMKVCITNGLQPVMLEAGLQGIWTPRLVPEIGYCEYQCTLCGHVCPTGAIPALPPEKKTAVRLGTAVINMALCIAWAQDKECIVCEEHCPVPDKAIKAEESFVDGKKILKPRVDPSLCVGCGICQNKCPVTPVRAIRVHPENAQRTAATGWTRIPFPRLK